jgi:hypothetical protein
MAGCGRGCGGQQQPLRHLVAQANVSVMPGPAHLLLLSALALLLREASSSAAAAAPAGSRLVSVQSSATRKFSFDLIDLDPLTGVIAVSPLNGSVSCGTPDPHVGKECLSAGATTNGAGADIVPPTDSPTGSALVVFTVQCLCPMLIGPNDEMLAYGPPIVLALDVRAVTLRPDPLSLTRLT